MMRSPRADGAADRDAVRQRERRGSRLVLVGLEAEKGRNVIGDHERPAVAGVEFHPCDPARCGNTRIDGKRHPFRIAHQPNRQFLRATNP
jgi:hypothetical protein